MKERGEMEREVISVASGRVTSETGKLEFKLQLVCFSFVEIFVVSFVGEYLPCPLRPEVASY